MLAEALLNKDLFFLVKGCLFPLIEDSIYKRRSTEDTKMALTDTIYEKVRSSFFPAAIRFLCLKAFFRRRGRAVIYVITVFVGRCSGRALSFLCLIPSYQTRRTSYQPAKGCETEPGTKNESISVYGSCWPFERNAVVVGSDSTRVECLVEGPK
uniref:Uncharacterized protein n=1 Tax=Sesuvium portulacastrum TaxID=221166 RepID=A0A6B9MKU1_SESPO|nr:hypothetical protein [Sesuvium portulacastrum]